MVLVVFIAAMGGLLATIELLAKRFSIPTAVSRKVAHVAAAAAAAVTPAFLSQRAIIATGLIFAAALLVTRRLGWFSSIHAVGYRTLGEIYLPLGVALCAWLFIPRQIAAFQFGVLTMGVADAAAALVGQTMGKHRVRVFGQYKSLEGSLAFFASSLLLVFLFVGAVEYRAVGIAFALTVLEFSLVRGLDNLVLPVVGAFLIRSLL